MTQVESALEIAEGVRSRAWQALAPESRAQLGQYFTPAPLARLMAQRCEISAGRDPLRILDPGAGVGSLGSAVLERLVRERIDRPVHLTAMELDTHIARELDEVRSRTMAWASNVGLSLTFEVIQRDFVEWASERLSLFGSGPLFDLVIMNPPYKKVASRSRHRRLTAEIGCDVTNLYAAFVALGLTTLQRGGQLVAITPRSFTNGPYFRPFRKFISERSAFRSVDLFESRSSLFADSEVLQENVVFSLVRDGSHKGRVGLSFHGTNGGVDEAWVDHTHLMPPGDSELFIFLRKGEEDQDTARVVNSLPCVLKDLGLEVSTGRVVAFRSREELREDPCEDCVPILYPQHLRGGFVSWPINSGHPNAIKVNEQTRRMLFPSGTFVAVKRFTTKEERRRVVPTLVAADSFRTTHVAFENHLNIIHSGGQGLERDLAVGLTLYLRSTVIDDYFRQYSGHTQVNATDLRSFRCPDMRTLRRLAKDVSEPSDLDQAEVDARVRDALE